ncbi:MAG TPA: hypothetical protein VFI72_19010, partial [Candidatus Angelobacter sp.]|nr:hypothetical protein [Candidatus Angelobacter sp.]
MIVRWCGLFVLIYGLALFGQSGSVQQAAGKALHQLIDAEWEYGLSQAPEFASEIGDRRWNDRWSDVSMEAIAQRHQHDKGVLRSL